MTAIEELRRTATAPARPRLQLTGEELRRLVSTGIAVGNHTLTHPCLNRCETEKIDYEILESHHILTEILKGEPRVLAYPNGDWDDRVLTVVAEVGYKLAFTFDHRVSQFPPPQPLLVSRVRVNSMSSPDRFALLASGLHPALHRLRGRS